jgi:hypothetical protein
VRDCRAGVERFSASQSIYLPQEARIGHFQDYFDFIGGLPPKF